MMEQFVASLLNQLREEKQLRLEYFRACTLLEDMHKNQGALDAIDQLDIMVRDKWQKIVKGDTDDSGNEA